MTTRRILVTLTVAAVLGVAVGVLSAHTAPGLPAPGRTPRAVP